MAVSPIQAGHMNPYVGQTEGSKAGRALLKEQEEKPDRVEELQARRQTIQNQILQVKSASDSAASPDTVNSLEEQLEKINAELKTARAGEAGPVAGASPSVAPQPRFDEYVEGKGRQPSPGLYEIKGDGEGGYQVSFQPYAENGEEAAPAAGGRDTPEGSKTTVNTDKVDAEIRKLKEKRESLEQQLNQAQNSGDGQKAEALKRKLAAADAEVSAKNNDAYRKQHAVITQG